MLRLTAQGWKIYDAVAPLAREHEQRLLAHLDADEQRWLARILDKLWQAELRRSRADRYSTRSPVLDHETEIPRESAQAFQRSSWSIQRLVVESMHSRHCIPAFAGMTSKGLPWHRATSAKWNRHVPWSLHAVHELVDQRADEE